MKPCKVLNIIALLLCVAVLTLLMVPQSSEAQSTKKIKVGVLGPMKFYPGTYQWNGALLTAEEINAAGGINVGGQKYQLDLIAYDSNDLMSIPDAVSAMERAIVMDKCDYILAGLRSEAVLAMQEIMADNKKIFIEGASGHPNQILRVKQDYDRYKYFFRTSLIAAFTTVGYSLADADFVGQTIRKELGIAKPKVALVLDKAAYCDGWTKLATDLFPKMGYEIVGTWRPNYKQTDLYAEANAIKSSGAHLIYTIMAGPSGAAFVNAWGKLKIPAAIAGTVTASQRSDFWETSGGACNYLASYDSIGRVKMTDQTIPFYDKYMERFGEKPGWGSPFMQASVLALKQALERANTFDTDAVIAALEKTDLVASTGRLKFNPLDHKHPHQAIFGPPYRTLVSFQWRDGKIIVYYPNATKTNPALVEADKEGVLVKLGDVKYEGTGEYQLPPWMVEHYKK